MTAYMHSLELLLERDDEIYWPTHGTCIKDPTRYVQAFIEHRIDRENQIIDCLNQGLTKINDMVPVMYTETNPNLYGAAARSVLAAIIRLIDHSRVNCDGTPSLEAEYQLT